jgi:hypothetical protein
MPRFGLDENKQQILFLKKSVNAKIDNHALKYIEIRENKQLTHI